MEYQYQLSDSDSQIILSGVTVNYIRADVDSLGVEVDNSSGVNEFIVGHVTPVSILPDKSFSGGIAFSIPECQRISWRRCKLSGY